MKSDVMSTRFAQFRELDTTLHFLLYMHTTKKFDNLDLSISNGFAFPTWEWTWKTLNKT